MMRLAIGADEGTKEPTDGRGHVSSEPNVDCCLIKDCRILEYYLKTTCNIRIKDCKIGPRNHLSYTAL